MLAIPYKFPSILLQFFFVYTFTKTYDTEAKKKTIINKQKKFTEITIKINKNHIKKKKTNTSNNH